mmetsp:Transcript_7087/g.20875  ORF Transcript_7087/g.20875 Transcript_7087/m.20875 type:complete len:119 (-) Transcript_7087:1640-1996(-)
MTGQGSKSKEILKDTPNATATATRSIIQHDENTNAARFEEIPEAVGDDGACGHGHDGCTESATDGACLQQPSTVKSPVPSPIRGAREGSHETVAVDVDVNIFTLGQTAKSLLAMGFTS